MFGNNRKSILQVFFGGIFSGDYDGSGGRCSWLIHCDNGEHEVSVRLGSTARDSKNLFIDGNHVAVIRYTGKGLIPTQTYDFKCEGEKLTLVFYANKVDLVQNGMLINSKIKYVSRSSFPVWIRICVVLMAMLSGAMLPVFVFDSISKSEILLMLFSITGTLCCSALALSFSGSPLLSTRRKVIFTLLYVFLAWIIQILCLFVYVSIKNI